MNRRQLLAAAALAGFGAMPRARADGVAASVPAGERVLLWPGTPPGGGGPQGEAEVSPGGAVRHVVHPTLTLFRPAGPATMVVLVASGGGYTREEDGGEGLPAAHWLAARGYAAALLDYRLPGEATPEGQGWGAGPAAPLQDARRALALLRAGALVPEARAVGLLGFSAGGHLMAMTAGAAPQGAYPPVDAADALPDAAPPRPDAVALLYPVLSLSTAFHATSTQRQIVGRDPAPELAARWSAPDLVDARYPPTFLVQAEDDRVSDPGQMALMEAACRRAGVPLDLHRLPSGGHGFGMGRPHTPSADWPGWFEPWLAARLPR